LFDDFDTEKLFYNINFLAQNSLLLVYLLILCDKKFKPLLIYIQEYQIVTFEGILPLMKLLSIMAA